MSTRRRTEGGRGDAARRQPLPRADRPRARRRSAAATIPVALEPPAAQVIEHPLEAGGRRVLVTATSMGNPHCASFLDAVADDALLARARAGARAPPVLPEAHERRVRDRARSLRRSACASGSAASATRWLRAPAPRARPSAAIITGRTGRSAQGRVRRRHARDRVARRRQRQADRGGRAPVRGRLAREALAAVPAMMAREAGSLASSTVNATRRAAIAFAFSSVTVIAQLVVPGLEALELDPAWCGAPAGPAARPRSIGSGAALAERHALLRRISAWATRSRRARGVALRVVGVDLRVQALAAADSGAAPGRCAARGQRPGAPSLARRASPSCRRNRLLRARRPGASPGSRPTATRCPAAPWRPRAWRAAPGSGRASSATAFWYGIPALQDALVVGVAQVHRRPLGLQRRARPLPALVVDERHALERRLAAVAAAARTAASRRPRCPLTTSWVAPSSTLMKSADSRTGIAVERRERVERRAHLRPPLLGPARRASARPRSRSSAAVVGGEVARARPQP